MCRFNIYSTFQLCERDSHGCTPFLTAVMMHNLRGADLILEAVKRDGRNELKISTPVGMKSIFSSSPIFNQLHISYIINITMYLKHIPYSLFSKHISPCPSCSKRILCIFYCKKIMKHCFPTVII